MNDILLRAQVRVQTTLYSLRHRQEGQGLVEYGLIIASIAILLIVAMLFLAGKIDDLFSKTGTSVDSAGPLPSEGPVGRSLIGRASAPAPRRAGAPLSGQDRTSSRNWPRGQLCTRSRVATLSSAQ